MESLRGAREAVQPLLDDLAFALRRYRNDVEASPERLQQVEDRLAALERLKRKYGPALDDVLERGRQLDSTVRLLEHASERKEELEACAASARSRFVATASALSDRRRKGAPALSSRIEGELGGLAMERARCMFHLEPAPDRQTDGARTGTTWGVRVLRKPGRGASAAGQDCVRRRALTRDARPQDHRHHRPAGKTLVFDEVDTGISGESRTRWEPSPFAREAISGDQRHHLPQVAAHATAHFSVVKRVEGGRSRVTVTKLAEEARPSDIAACSRDRR